MKYSKIIPALLMVTMLAACDLNKSAKAGSLKEPKFAKASEEIDYAAFVEDISNDEWLGDFASGDVTKLPSFKYSNYEGESNSQKVTRNKKVLRDSVENNENSNDVQIDTTNNRLHYEHETSYYESYKVETGKEVGKSSQKASYNAQLNKFEDGHEYVIEINNEEELFYRITDSTNMTESEKKSFLFNNYFQAYQMVWYTITPDSFWDVYYDYPGLTDEEKNCYKFYRDNKVYTVEYVFEEEYPVKDADYNLLYTQKDRTELKFQLDTSKRLESKVSYKELKTNTQTLTFNKNMAYSSYMYLEGDVLEYKTVNVIEVSAEKDEKLEVKELDLSKLHDMDASNNQLLP